MSYCHGNEPPHTCMYYVYIHIVLQFHVHLTHVWMSRCLVDWIWRNFRSTVRLCFGNWSKCTLFGLWQHSCTFSVTESKKSFGEMWSQRFSEVVFSVNRTSFTQSSLVKKIPGKSTLGWAAANGGVTNGGLRGVWPPCLEIGQNRPFSPFFCLFRPFPEGAKSTWEIRKRRKKAFFLRYPQICLSPHLLNPHLRHSNN